VIRTAQNSMRFGLRTLDESPQHIADADAASVLAILIHNWHAQHMQLLEDLQSKQKTISVCSRDLGTFDLPPHNAFATLRHSRAV
jgi:hypothetical protein